jgi:hypothetical protein
MEMKEISRSEELPSKGQVLLYLYTTMSTVPISSMAKIMRNNPIIQFVKTDIGVPSEIYDEYSVGRVPAFMFLNDGILLWSYLGTDIKYIAAKIKSG